MSDPDPFPPEGADRAAAEAWERVRRLGEEARRWRVSDADSPEAEMRRARAVLKAERAARRAQLADELADALAEVRRIRDRRVDTAGG